MKLRTMLATSVAVAAMSLAGAAMADAGFIALEGSDATALHFDAQYTPQLFSYLQGSSGKNVLVYNPAGVIDLSSISGGVPLTNVTSLVGLTLSDYAAIYIESPGGCCTANNTVLNGFGADVNAFIAGGGNLSIENYIGGDYDGVIPGATGAPAGVIEGYTALNGGVGTGPTCTDGETVTALGLAKGFTQPPVDGCWSHQAYDNTYWSTFGYIDLMHADPSFVFRNGGTNGSSFLAVGGSLGDPTPGGIPEPATWAMLILGFASVGAAMRRRRLSLAV